MRPVDYWFMTPRELWLAAKQKRMNDRIALIELAHMTAAYTRMKKMPNLKNEILKIQGPRKLSKAFKDRAKENQKLLKQLKVIETDG